MKEKMGSGSGFKLDMDSVERDEDRVDFLNACSRLEQRHIRALVDTKGLDVATALDHIGQNCLHFVVCSAEAARGDPQVAAAAVELQTQLVGYLVQKGAAVDAARASDGWTPLFLAVAFGLTQMVTALLGEGAKTRVKDQAGLTPEDLADKYRMPHIKTLLVHSRHKVPHSRFSCVQQGPALESTTSTSSATSTPSHTSSTSSEEAAPSSSSSEAAPQSVSSSEDADVAAAAAAASTQQQQSAEQPCLLTAQ